MQLPNLPTDNLYKFIALSGVLIFIVSYILFYTTADRTQELLRGLNEDLAIAEVMALPFENKKNEGGAFKLRAEMVSDIEELKFLVEQRSSNIFIFRIFSVLGLVLSTYGFWLWYTRVQIYQDIILKNEALKHESSNAPNK